MTKRDLSWTLNYKFLWNEVSGQSLQLRTMITSPRLTLQIKRNNADKKPSLPRFSIHLSRRGAWWYNHDRATNKRYIHLWMWSPVSKGSWVRKSREHKHRWKLCRRRWVGLRQIWRRTMRLIRTSESQWLEVPKSVKQLLGNRSHHYSYCWIRPPSMTRNLSGSNCKCRYKTIDKGKVWWYWGSLGWKELLSISSTSEKWLRIGLQVPNLIGSVRKTCKIK